jgi:hypothetical protein
MVVSMDYSLHKISMSLKNKYLFIIKVEGSSSPYYPPCDYEKGLNLTEK